MDDLEHFRSIPQIQESYSQKNQSYFKMMCYENACLVPQIVIEVGTILELRQEDFLELYTLKNMIILV